MFFRNKFFEFLGKFEKKGILRFPQNHHHHHHLNSDFEKMKKQILDKGGRIKHAEELI